MTHSQTVRDCLRGLPRLSLVGAPPPSVTRQSRALKAFVNSRATCSIVAITIIARLPAGAPRLSLARKGSPIPLPVLFEGYYGQDLGALPQTPPPLKRWTKLFSRCAFVNLRSSQRQIAHCKASINSRCETPLSHSQIVRDCLQAQLAGSVKSRLSKPRLRSAAS